MSHEKIVFSKFSIPEIVAIAGISVIGVLAIIIVIFRNFYWSQPSLTTSSLQLAAVENGYKCDSIVLPAKVVINFENENSRTLIQSLVSDHGFQE